MLIMIAIISTTVMMIAAMFINIIAVIMSLFPRHVASECGNFDWTRCTGKAMQVDSWMRSSSRLQDATKP